MQKDYLSDIELFPNFLLVLDKDQNIIRSNDSNGKLNQYFSEFKNIKKALDFDLKYDKVYAMVSIGNIGRYDIMTKKTDFGGIVEFIDRENISEMLYQERFKYLIHKYDKTGDILLIVNGKGKVIDFNDALLMLSSENREQIIGHGIFENITKEYGPLFRRRIREAMNGLTAGPDLIEVKTTKGTFFLEGIISPVLSIEKPSKYLYIVIKNKTKEKTSNDKILETKTLNENIINGIDEGIIVIDAEEDKIILGNNWWSNRLDIPPQDFSKFTSEQFFKKDVQAWSSDQCELINEIRKTGMSACKTLSTEVDGRFKALNISAFPIRNSKNKIDKIVHITNDVTKSILMQKELDKKLKKLSAIFDLSKSISLRTNLEGILNIFILKIASLLKISKCVIFLFNQDNQHLTPRSYYNIEDKEIIPYDNKLEKLAYAKDALDKGESIYLDNIPDYRKMHSFVSKSKIKSFACIPLKFEQQKYGVINLYFHNETSFSKDDMELLDSIGYQASIVLENYRLFNESKTMNKQILNLYSTSTVLQATMEVDKILDIGLKTFSNLGYDRVRIYLFDKENKSIIGAKSTHMSDKKMAGIIMDRKSHKIGYKVLEERRPIKFSGSEFKKYKLYNLMEFEGVNNILFLPLLSKETPIGLVSLDNKYTQREIKDQEIASLMSFTNQIAIAIENAGLYNEIIGKNKQLWALYNSSSLLQETMDIEKIGDIVIENLKNQGYERIRIYLYNEDDKLFYGFCSNHVPLEIFKKVRIDINKNYKNKKNLFEKRKPLVFHTKNTKYKQLLEKNDVKETASLPLISKRNIIGFISIDNKYSMRAINERDLIPLMTFSNQIAVAIENARLYLKIKEFNETLQDEVYSATKELEDKNKRLMELDKLKSEFVNVVSHELRTPLTSIKGYSTLLVNNQIKDKEVSKKALNIIKTESDRLTNLLNDILDLSKLESGKSKLMYERCNITDLINNVIDAQGFLINEKKIKLKVDIPKDIFKVEIDKEKIKQVLFNLINNAIKYSNPKSKLEVKVRVMGDSLVVSIVDTGRGIPDDEIIKLFDKFYQAESHMIRTEQGTGLGLAIVKEILMLHNSMICVQSKEQKGTSFSFVLHKDMVGLRSDEEMRWENIECNCAECDIRGKLSEKCWVLYFPSQKNRLTCFMKKQKVKK